MELPPILIAVGIVIVGLVVGVALVAADRVFIGIVIALAALPIGLVAWVMAGDR